jgi:oligopeptidase B
VVLSFINRKSYDPYRNVVAQKYPHMLLVAGINDSRVSYWYDVMFVQSIKVIIKFREPAKLTAKLREKKTDDNLLILKTDCCGHFGESGYHHYENVAFRLAFAIMATNK